MEIKGKEKAGMRFGFGCRFYVDSVRALRSGLLPHLGSVGGTVALLAAALHTFEANPA